jgi:prepilin-type N-terminal cleavage/methylation domain-containing protein
LYDRNHTPLSSSLDGEALAHVQAAKLKASANLLMDRFFELPVTNRLNQGSKMPHVKQRCISKNEAFTLVELAIVIVIIGLLVSGVLHGQELIKQANLRKDIKRLTEIQTATVTFFGKYNFLPGDMPNDVSMRLLQEDSVGNGDGKFTWQLPYEPSRFWQHLAKAKMLLVTNAHYNLPYPLSAGNMDNNVSRYAKFRDDRSNRNGAIVASTGDIFRNSVAIGMQNLGNIFSISDYSRTEADVGYFKPSFLVEHVWSIDAKLDDGKPTTGKLKGADAFAPDGSTIIKCHENGIYRLEETQHTCRVFYDMGV